MVRDKAFKNFQDQIFDELRDKEWMAACKQIPNEEAMVKFVKLATDAGYSVDDLVRMFNDPQIGIAKTINQILATESKDPNTET